MTQINVDLFGEQATLVNDWVNSDKHCIDIVPAGSGKTFLSSYFLPIAASDSRYHRGKDVIYSAPTQTMIKALVWEQLKKNCREYFGIPESAINNSELTIKFPTGVFIRCKSAEQRENLRGLNSGIWIADEASLYTEDTLQEMFNRLRPRVGAPDTAGRMIIISTPYGAGPLYELYNTARANPDRYIIRHFDYEQMRSGNKEFILEQKKILSPMKFAQDYLCSFESVTDQFFYTFQPQFHTAPLEDTGRGDLYHFADFNKRVATSVIARIRDPYTPTGSMEVIRAYTIENCGTEQLAQTIRADFPGRRIWSIIDMSGSQLNRDTTSAFGITDKVLLEKYGFTIMNTNKANPLISDTDNSCNAFINQGRLRVNASETRLIEALKTYHFEDGTRKKLVKYNDKFAYIDGLGDCMRYGIYHLFPIVHASSPLPEYIDSLGDTYKMPGQEYITDPNYRETVDGVPTVDYLIRRMQQDHSDETWM